MNFHKRDLICKYFIEAVNIFDNLLLTNRNIHGTTEDRTVPTLNFSDISFRDEGIIEIQCRLPHGFCLRPSIVFPKVQMCQQACTLNGKWSRRTEKSAKHRSRHDVATQKKSETNKTTNETKKTRPSETKQIDKRDEQKQTNDTKKNETDSQDHESSFVLYAVSLR